MTAAKKLKMTVAEFLASERTAARKHEFLNGEIFAMAGASRLHNRVKENLIVQVGGRVWGGPCHSYSSDQRVQIPETGLITYPDFLIVCGEDEFSPDDPETLTNPRVIIEVLSPSTEDYDRHGKFTHYQRLPSLQEYVLFSQEEVRVERFVRQADDSWQLTVYADPAADFELMTVPLRVPLADLFRGVAVS